LRGYYPPKFALYDSENPLEYGSQRWGDVGWAFDPVWDKPFEEETQDEEATLKSFYTTDICFSGMCRAFRQTEFSGSTPEEIRSIGPDASIYYWQMFMQLPKSHIDLQWLDIHTLPQHRRPVWESWRRFSSDLYSVTIRDCKIRRIPFDAIADKYESIAIINCPLFEGFDDLPTSCNIRIQVENCPLFYHSPVAFIPANSSHSKSTNVNRLFVHRFPHGDAYNGHIFTSVRTFTLPNLGKMMDFWSRAREELAAEAFKPARLDRRIEEFGLESALEC